ncbi:protein of unknown function [Petrocella atlantisensis]|uniref:Uncharacterized protein n=1 Tax=Petrocella atlantisensis TaxID=2173034 RepID=A0A3P7PDM1_9FIRM|nr:protein of unknown function [Petrocella atlantisensis]
MYPLLETMNYNNINAIHIVMLLSNFTFILIKEKSNYSDTGSWTSLLLLTY